MKARPFIIFMFLLLVLTSVLLVFASPRKQPAEGQSGIGTVPGTANIQVQVAEGSIIWETLSGHLLSAMQ